MQPTAAAAIGEPLRLMPSVDQLGLSFDAKVYERAMMGGAPYLSAAGGFKSYWAAVNARASR